MNLLEALDNDFSKDVRERLTKLILLATRSFDRFMQDNKSFFTYSKYNSLKSYLLQYSINRTLTDAAFKPDAFYRTQSIPVNKFNHSIVHLYTDNFIVTTAKTKKPMQLPCASKYKKDYAKSNVNGSGQLVMDFIENVISQEDYYALLTYNYNMQKSECEHIHVVVPDDRFKSIVGYKDLTPSKKNVYLYPTSKEVEENIVSFNEEFEKIVKLKIKSGD